MPENDYGIDIEAAGVPRGEGESWQELVDRRRGRDREWFACPCGARYRSRRARIRCCESLFGEVDVPAIATDGATDEDVRKALSEN